MKKIGEKIELYLQLTPHEKEANAERFFQELAEKTAEILARKYTD